MLSVNDNVIGKDIHVNTLTHFVHQKRHILLSGIIRESVLSQQQTWIDIDIGIRFHRNRNNSSFRCPKCQQCRFNRKGIRSRKYKCIIGKIELPILQVRCCFCGHRFCPYKDRIGLSFKDRISPDLIEKQLSLTCEMPYWKARHFVESLLFVSVSPNRIRKKIDLESERIGALPITGCNQIGYIDSTKVPAGRKERGENIHFAVSAVPGTRGNRPAMVKRFLFLTTGDAEAIKQKTKELRLSGLVHDGDIDFSGCAPHVQRCLWHLPHQLKHFLWDDGVPYEQRAPLVDELIQILFSSKRSEEMKQRYSAFMEKLNEKGFQKSYTHLKNAENELTTSRDYNFDYHTTSPIEREMREINRRAEIGVRWSVKGVENLLRVKMYNRLVRRP